MKHYDPTASNSINQMALRNVKTMSELFVSNKLTSIDQFDPLSLPVLEQLNRIPGLSTIWSCSGHSESLQPAYYTCVATDEAAGILRDIRRQIQSNLFAAFEELGLSDDKNPAWKLTYTEGVLRWFDDGDWYETFSLRLRSPFHHPNHDQLLSDVMVDTLKECCKDFPEIDALTIETALSTFPHQSETT